LISALLPSRGEKTQSKRELEADEKKRKKKEQMFRRKLESLSASFREQRGKMGFLGKACLVAVSGEMF
jgi:hypothetical protein